VHAHSSSDQTILSACVSFCSQECCDAYATSFNLVSTHKHSKL